MSPLVVGGVVAAIVVVALALQVLARTLQGLPLDQRRADPLIDVSRRATGSMRPAELHQLTMIVANSILSDASYRTELQPILDQLEQGPGVGPDPGPADVGDRRRPGGRNRRSDRIEQAIADLERRTR